MLGVAVVGIIFAVLKWLETTLRDRQAQVDDQPSARAESPPDFTGQWSD